MTRKKKTTAPSGPDGQHTMAMRIQIADVRRQLRYAGQPRREAPDVIAAISVAQTFRRARAMIAAERLPQGGD